MNTPDDLNRTSPGSAERADKRLVLLLAILLAAGTMLLYAPAMQNGFVNFDDTDYVTRNAHVLQGVTWANLRWAFGTDNPAANWHPLTWMAHMLDVQLYGAKAAGHHFTNVLLQTVDIVILFLLLARATGHALRSAAVAALFALHPLNVESVAWVAELKTVLCMFFLLLTVWAYGWYVRKPGVGRYLVVFAFFALALMSKLMVVTLPFGLLLLDYWPLGRFSHVEDSGEKRGFLSRFLTLAIEKIPLLLLSVAASLITLGMHRKEGALAAAMPLSWRLKNAIYSYWVYLGKAIWPSRLAVFYPHPENSLAWWKVITAAVLLAGISAMVWRFREKKYLVFGWLWFLGTMVPMIGIVQSGRQGMAGRFMYIPMLGLLVAMVWLVADWAPRLRIQRGIAALCFVALVSPYVSLTRKQIGYWHDSLSLFSYTLQVTDNNGMAENNMGAALVEKGQPELAQTHFETAVRLIPELASAHYNLAVLWQRQNRTEQAVREYRQAIALSSDPMEAAQAHNNLGILYLMSKNYTAALPELSAAIALNPDEQNSYIGRGMIELESWNYPAAVADFARATEISPSPIACFWLGQALERKGDYPRAENAYMAALQLAPEMTEARNRLEALRGKVGGRP
ncbi:MAG: protein O-mannosyl-transferase [Acidobacteriaceae bacterium]|jgi:Flp pilus assembly protein TadD|nr:protein O-mannosyl-transferase [Acidobacteriaceae bacterium]